MPVAPELRKRSAPREPADWRSGNDGAGDVCAKADVTMRATRTAGSVRKRDQYDSSLGGGPLSSYIASVTIRLASMLAVKRLSRSALSSIRALRLQLSVSLISEPTCSERYRSRLRS